MSLYYLQHNPPQLNIYKKHPDLTMIKKGFLITGEEKAMQKMKAAKYYGSSDIRVEEVPVPETRKGEMKFKVEACGICGSDVHGMDGSTGRRIPPIIMGHEASGVITEVGENVKDWQKVKLTNRSN